MELDTKKLLKKLYSLSTAKTYSPEEIKTTEKTLMNKIKIRKINIFNFNDLSSSNNVLKGAYMDHAGYAVATDAIQLIASRKDYKEEFKGKIVDKKNKVIEENYINWKRIIPTDGSNFQIRSFEDIKLDLVKAMAFDCARFSESELDSMVIKISDGFWINAIRVENFLSCLKDGYSIYHTGKNITLKKKDGSLAMFAKSDFDCSDYSFGYVYMNSIESF